MKLWAVRVTRTIVQTQIATERHSGRLVTAFADTLQTTVAVIPSKGVAQQNLSPENAALLKAFFELLARWDEEAAQ